MAAPPSLKKPLQIYRGDTLARTYTIGLMDEETGTVTGVNLLPFGNVWTAQLRPSENSSEKIDLVVDISQLSLGKITLRLDSVTSEDVFNKGVFDVQVTDTTVTPHIVRTIMRGDFVLNKDVTRP